MGSTAHGDDRAAREWRRAWECVQRSAGIPASSRVRMRLLTYGIPATCWGLSRQWRREADLLSRPGIVDQLQTAMNFTISRRNCKAQMGRDSEHGRTTATLEPAKQRQL